MKYYVKIVEDCIPKLYEFKTKKAMESFKKSFLKKVDNEGTWIEFIIKGHVLFKDGYYEKT